MRTFWQLPLQVQDAVDEGFSPASRASPRAAALPDFTSPGQAGSPYNAGGTPLMGSQGLGSAPRYQPSLQACTCCNTCF